MKLKGFSDWGVCFNVIGLMLGTLAVIIDQVQSQRRSRWSEGTLRLVGGRSKKEGTVLIYHWSRWGSICDDYWDIRDANVVCNELGYAGAKEAPRRSRFGKGRRRVWLSGLHCRGNERHLTMCYSRGWGNHVEHCKSYWSSAGVVCNGKKTTTSTTTISSTTPRPTTTTRKTTTTTATTTTTTTTPTPKTTTTTERTTTTTKTTTPSTTTTTVPTTQKTTTARKKSTTTPKPTTTTRKPTTVPRVYNQWVYDRETWRYYMYFRDGSFITSRPDPRYLRMQNSTARSTTTTTTTTTTTPRPTPRPRRIESNSIYNVVDQAINRNNNDVEIDLSNRLDPNDPQDIHQRPDNNHIRHEHHSNRHHHHRKDGYLQDQPVFIPENADRNLNTIDDVVETPEDSDDYYIETNEVENQPEAVKPTAPGYTEFRLLGGRNYTGYKEGRIEVRLANSFTWGVICGDNWDLPAAIVACKHFNAGYARQAQKTDYYGGSTMDKVIATLRCTGKEERLEDCTIEQHEHTPSKAACSRPSSVAGIICDARLPDLEPDLKAIEESIFLRDRYLYYLQCAYEENCLSSSANELYGTRNWAYATRRLLHFSTIAKNIGTADFRPDIDRSQWEWHACHQHYHSMESFSHYDIIDEHGNQVAEGHKASFCLEDSKCDRGVFPKYNCQGYGYQGISVGCSDSYLADIDCQWIDVTDVKPGLYTLKIELNPGMKVPELSFDNNVARCDLYFNTRQAKVTNCRLDSLL